MILFKNYFFAQRPIKGSLSIVLQSFQGFLIIEFPFWFRLPFASIVETSFPELAVSFFNFSPWISLGTFLILLSMSDMNVLSQSYRLTLKRIMVKKGSQLTITRERERERSRERERERERERGGGKEGECICVCMLPCIFWFSTFLHAIMIKFTYNIWARWMEGGVQGYSPGKQFSRISAELRYSGLLWTTVPFLEFLVLDVCEW